MEATRLVPVLVGALLLAGCVTVPSDPIGGSAVPPPAARAAARVFADCECWEPAIAVDGEGRVLVVSAHFPRLAVSEDGGATFEERDAPPVPPGAPEGAALGDTYVETGPDGRVYLVSFVALWADAVAPPAPTGLQFAVTADGGRTWEPNLYFDLADRAPAPWKSWLGFGADGQVVLAYNQRPALLMVATSEDGGASWSPFVVANQPGDRSVSVFPGAPIVDAAGRIIVPYLGDQMPNLRSPTVAFLFPSGALRLAVSEDGGATWRQQDVATALPPASVGTWFPRLLPAGDGRLALVYLDPALNVVLRTSDTAGATWSEPVVWSEHPDSIPAPWARVRDGELTVVFGEPDGESMRLAWARGPVGAAAPPTARGYVGEESTSQSDFAHFDYLPDGTIAVLAHEGDDVVVRYVG